MSPKYIAHKIYSLLSLSLLLHLLLSSLGLSAVAEQAKDRGEIQTTNSDFGLPTHRRDGGSRGNQNNCVTNPENQNLIALIPDNVIGSNSTNNLKLFFYVPKINQQKTLEFVLRNEGDELVYEAFFETEGNGIVSVEVPGNLNSSLLATDHNYHWYLSLMCDRRQRSRDLVVEGWLRQEALARAAQEQLNDASSVQQAKIYQDHGFWYSALSVLAEDPDSIAEQPMVRQKWTEMLESVGLKEFASEPFVDKELIETSPDAL